MDFRPIHTRQFNPPKDDIFDLIDTSLPQLQEKDILVITSKIVSIHQGRCIEITQKAKNGPPPMKIELIKEEADAYDPDKPHSLTVKNKTLIPYAGIDRSNGDGYYILWPEKPAEFAKEVWQYLTHKYNLQEFGVIISDSCLLPFRLGVTGISIGFFGFHPLKPYAEKQDVFGRNMNKAVNTNIADSISSFASALMGEGGEQTPLLLIKEVDFVQFTDKDTYKEIFIPEERDLYTPLLKCFKKNQYKF